MKNNTVPSVTRKRVSELSRRDLEHLRQLLAKLWHLREGLTPANRKRMHKLSSHVAKRQEQLRREFWKPLHYKGPKFRKVRGGLKSGTLWDTTDMAKAYKDAMRHKRDPQKYEAERQGNYCPDWRTSHKRAMNA